VNAKSGERIAMFLYWRTDSLTKGMAMRHQIRAALRAHFAPTCVTRSWVVVTNPDPAVPSTFGGNPSMSADVTEMVL